VTLPQNPWSKIGSEISKLKNLLSVISTIDALIKLIGININGRRGLSSLMRGKGHWARG